MSNPKTNMSGAVVILERIRRLLLIIIFILTGGIAFTLYRLVTPEQRPSEKPDRASSVLWQSPDDSTIPRNSEGDLIRYGRELIAHTARYLGPKGEVMQTSNGLNCQNCHLQAGTKPFAANYSAVASTYPKFRARSGTVEGFGKRINDCIERSLNGSGLPEDSREMRAIIAYVKWVGKDVPRGLEPAGAGLTQLSMLDRPADPLQGQQFYAQYCASCHGADGEGIMGANGKEWQYPPLWGANSYNTGAGLFRLSRFAAFIKANMPFGTSYDDPVLSDEEAWDIAAFVNTMPRPHKEFSGDWPDLSKKPVDHPFGPYPDGLSEKAHKYGPFIQNKSAGK